MNTLRDYVRDALCNATINGYRPTDQDARDLCEDLRELDADLEAYSTDELFPHVREWLAEH